MHRARCRTALVGAWGRRGCRSNTLGLLSKPAGSGILKFPTDLSAAVPVNDASARKMLKGSLRRLQVSGEGTARSHYVTRHIMSTLDEWHSQQIPLAAGTYSFAMGVLCKHGKPDACDKIYGIMRDKGVPITTAHYNMLMQAHLINGSFEKVQSYWQELGPKPPLCADVISYTTYLKACAGKVPEAELVDLASEMIQKFDRGGGTHREMAYTIIAPVLPYRMGVVLHSGLTATGVRPSIRFLTAMLKGAINDNIPESSKLEALANVERLVSQSGVVVDVRYINTVLLCYAKARRFDQACAVLQRLDKLRIAGNVTTFNIMLELCTATASGDGESPAAHVARELYTSAKLQGFGAYSSLHHGMLNFLVSVRDVVGAADLIQSLEQGRTVGRVVGTNLKLALKEAKQKLKKL